jgi:predicted MFS family arabinose efflux permease
MTVSSPARTPFRLPKRVAFSVQISIVIALFAGSAAPTPLYSVYQEKWGFSPITTTVVFATYSISVLVALVTFGPLSDHVGRRPVLIPALVVLAGAELIFAFANGVPTLITARVVQGLATGVAASPVGAGMIDLYREKGVLANTGTGPIGAALGFMGSGLLVQYLPLPTKLIYLVLCVVFLLQALGIYLSNETCPGRPGALASLRPQFGLPKYVRTPFLLAAPALITAYALSGLYGALGPSLVHKLTNNPSHVLGALSAAAFSGCGGVAVLLIRSMTARAMMFVSASMLILGLTGLLVSISHTSTPGFFLSSAVIGIGFGLGYQAGIRTVMVVVSARERAGVLSLLLVVSYIAMGVPTVVAGIRVVHAGVFEAATEFGIFAIVLSSLALLGVFVGHRKAEVPHPPTPAETDLAIEIV